MCRKVQPPISYRKPLPAQRTVCRGMNWVTSSTFSSFTALKVAVPVAFPLRPRCSCTRSVGLVARNSTEIWRSEVPATLWEALVKGKLSMERQAPRAVG